MKRPKPRLAALLVSFLAICACDDSPSKVAGGEDFPNTVDAVGVLGRLAQEAADSSGDWNVLSDDLLAMPAAEPEAAAVAMADPVAPMPLVAARSAAAATDYDFADTAKGWVVLRMHTLTATLNQFDTLWVAWDERVRDTIKDNERVYRMSSRKTNLSTLRSEYSRAIPLAPDTMLTPLPGKANRIRLHQEISLGRSITVLDMELDPGADLSYDTEADNRMRRATTVRLRGSDTLEITTWEDGDGDSIVLDRTTGKPGIVASVRTVPNPSSLRLKRIEERGRLLVDPRDTTATQPLRFERTTLWASGRVVVERMARAKSDSDLVAGDTAHLWRRATLGSDTVETRFDLLMGAILSDSTSRRLLGYSLRHRNPQGRILSLSFVADAPMVPGETALTGTVVFDVRQPAGRTFHLAGRWDRGALSGHVDDGASLSGTATWDPSGNLTLWNPD